jgi:excisionase family DNA binding protein
MPTPLPVKTPVNQRATSMALQALRAQQEREKYVVDPLLKLSEALPMLGNPGYQTLRRWIRDGSLSVWRVGRGHMRVRLSEISRFRTAGEVQNGTR